MRNCSFGRLFRSSSHKSVLWYQKILFCASRVRLNGFWLFSFILALPVAWPRLFGGVCCWWFLLFLFISISLFGGELSEQVVGADVLSFFERCQQSLPIFSFGFFRKMLNSRNSKWSTFLQAKHGQHLRPAASAQSNAWSTCAQKKEKKYTEIQKRNITFQKQKIWSQWLTLPIFLKRTSTFRWTFHRLTNNVRNTSGKDNWKEILESSCATGVI